MESIRVKDVLETLNRPLPQTIHVVLKDATLKEVLDTLYTHHILSAPVVDYQSNILGFIDVLGVLEFLVQVVSEPIQSRVTPMSASLRSDDMDMIIRRSERFDTSSVLSEVNLLARNPFLPCTLGAPLDAVLRNFACGVRRMPVVSAEETSQILAIITQTDANRFLATDPERFLGSKLANASLSSLGLVCGPEKLVAVGCDTIAVDAFLLMHTKGLDALAVVDDQGAFHGCLSATDLKLLTNYRFQALLLPVAQFLDHVRKEQGKVCKTYEVWCIPSTPLVTVLKKLADQLVHRVFVVDPVTMKPEGVVSLTDIARIVTGGHKD